MLPLLTGRRARRRPGSGHGPRRARRHHRRCTATSPPGTTSPTARTRAASRGWPRRWTRCGARYPGQVVVVDAGRPAAGRPVRRPTSRAWARRSRDPIIEAMNLAGYDAATPGDRDFDWGLPFLAPGGRRTRASPTSAPTCASTRRRAALSRRTASSSGRASASASPGSPRPADGLGPRPAGAARPAGADSPRRRRPVLAGDAAGRRRRGGAGPLRARRPRRPTTRPVSAPSTRRPCSPASPRRPDLVVVGHSHREIRDSVLGGVHFVQPTAVRRRARGRASRPGTRARIAGGSPRVRADLSRPAAVAAVAAAGAAAGPGTRDAVRAWTRTPSGSRSARCGRPRRGSSRTRSSTSCTDVQRRPHGRASSRRRRPSISGPVSTPTRSAWPHVLALYPVRRTPCARVRVCGAQLKATWSGARATSRSIPPGGSRSTTPCPGYRLRLVRGARVRRSTCAARSATGSSELTVRGTSGRAATDSFTLALNSYRQPAPAATTCSAARRWCTTRASGSPSCSIEAVRARSPLDPGASTPAGSGGSCRRSPTAPCGTLRRGAARCPAARDTVVLRLLATGELHGALLAGRGRRSPPRWTAWARLRLPSAAARRGRRHAGHTAPERDQGPRRHRAARPAGLRRRGARRPRLRLVARRAAAAPGASRRIRGSPPTCGTASPAGGRTGSSPCRMLDVGRASRSR